MPPHRAYLTEYLRRLAAVPALAREADGRLIERFTRSRDEDAFAALVARHAPMVLRVCRRVLADPDAAQDACQATFFVLARRAGSLRRPEALASWLYGVARRIAQKERAATRRRHARAEPAPEFDPPDPHPDPLAELSARDLCAIVDAEVQRLPESYRLPVILCCLEGRTREEAAQLLGWTPGAVKGRLERGRARLHARLVRRGLTLSVGLGAVEAARAVTPGLPADFVRITFRAALAFAAGPGATSPAGVSASVAALAQAGLQGLAAARRKIGLIVLLAGAALATATGLVAHATLSGGAQPARAGSLVSWAHPPSAARHHLPTLGAARAASRGGAAKGNAAPAPEPGARLRRKLRIQQGSATVTVRREVVAGRDHVVITVATPGGVREYATLREVPDPYSRVAKILLDRTRG